jgi:predicted nucleic-acid-binding Zn-ribbon protein
MKSSGKCPKCKSSDIIVDAKVVDRAHYNAGQDLSIQTFRDPDAFLFKGDRNSTVSAWVCRTCGYVELYADSVGALG